MKIAIIDIGTNSIRLFIPNKEKLIESKKFVIITRIGEDVDKNRFLLEKSIRRTIDGIIEFKKFCNDFKIEKIYAMATSAVRDAENKDYFVSLVKKETDIDVEILCGDEEAELGMLGSLSGISNKYKDKLIVDIGGGSTEIINVVGDEIKKIKSFNIGAVRLNEIAEVGKKYKNEDIILMGKKVDEIIGDFIGESNGVMIGIGGTITTLAMISLGEDEYNRKKVHNSKISLGKIINIFDRLVEMDIEKRKKVPGLDENRADIIIAGIVIIIKIMEKNNANEIIVSDYDNLEGYYFKNIKKVVDL